MFGIGIQELAVIFIVALLIFGPKRLPEFARSLGKGLAEFRRASSDLRQSFSLDDPPGPSASANSKAEDPRISETEPPRPAQAVDARMADEPSETQTAKKPGKPNGA